MNSVIDIAERDRASMTLTPTLSLRERESEFPLSANPSLVRWKKVSGDERFVSP